MPKSTSKENNKLQEEQANYISSEDRQLAEGLARTHTERFRYWAELYKAKILMDKAQITHSDYKPEGN